MRRLPLALLLAWSAAAGAQYRGEITVARVIVDARITDDRGNAIRDLTTEDLTATVGGIPAEIEAVEWIQESPARDASSVDAAAAVDEPMQGEALQKRIVVVFVQTDFARNDVRVKGQMKFRTHAEKILRALGPDDRVAVFSFDSHLKFRLDLTNDKDAVIREFRNTLWIDHPPPPPAVPEPSLAPRLDREAMRRVASSESALRLIADALVPIPAPKILLLFGWGLGERRGRVIEMRREWGSLRQELDAARVSIYALDTTYAGYHDLEFGLRGAAEATGGFYAKTHEFADAVVTRFRNTIEGRYEITLRGATLPAGTHPVKLRVKRRGAIVLAPTTITIR